MIIKVKLFADLRKHAPSPGEDVQLLDMPVAYTVGEVLDHLDIPPDKPRVLLVNGIHAERETVLHEGDVLAVFPPVAGC